MTDWAEHEMTLKPNSATALHGPTAAEVGRATIEHAVSHHPADPDPDLAAKLEQARRGIGRSNREVSEEDR